MKKYRIIHLTTDHSRYDTRIYLKQCSSLSKKKNCEIILIVADGLGNEKLNNIKILDLGRPSNKLSSLIISPIKSVIKLIFMRFHILHIHDPELLFVGFFFRVLNYKVIYDSHEDHPKQILSRYHLPPFVRKLLSNGMNYLEYFLLWRYNLIISATDSIKKSLIKKNKKIFTINNYPIVDEMNTEKREKNTLVYVGFISEIRGIKELIKSLNKSEKVIKLNLIGNFKSQRLYNEVKKYKGWKKVRYYGKLERKEVKNILSKSEVGIVPFYPEPNHIESQPNKLYEYMESGLPVIISNFKKWEKFVNKHQCGYVFDPLNVNDISKVCNKIFKNKELLKLMSTNSRNVIKKKFSWKNEENKLLKIYDGLL